MDCIQKKLENGITIKTCAMPNTHSVTIILSLYGGMAWEPLSQNGITHLVEHLCFRRCNGVEQKEFYYNIEKTGGWLRGVTYRDSVLFEMTVHPKYFNDAISIIRSLFEDNGWTHQDIRREKEVVYTQINKPEYWCLNQMISNYFVWTPAGERICGNKNKIKRLSRPQLVAWKNQLFNPMYANLIIAGEVENTKLDVVEDLFSEIEQHEKFIYKSIEPIHFLNRQSCDDRYYIGSSDYIKIGLTFDVDLNKVNTEVAEMLVSSLFNGLYTPFKLSLREKMGLLDEIDTDIQYFDFGGIIYVVFEVLQKDAEVLLDEISKIFSDQKKHFDGRAFECTKSAFTKGKEIILTDSQEFAYLMLNENISTPVNYLKNNEDITLQILQQSAKEIYKPENLVVTIYDIKDDNDFIDEIYNKKEILREKLGE